MRLKNVDLKKLSKDIDAIMKEENTKKEFEEELSKDYEAKWVYGVVSVTWFAEPIN